MTFDRQDMAGFDITYAEFYAAFEGEKRLEDLLNIVSSFVGSLTNPTKQAFRYDIKGKKSAPS